MKENMVIFYRSRRRIRKRVETRTMGASQGREGHWNAINIDFCYGGGA